MKQYINVETWERGSSFRHFRDYTHPYFGISTRVDVTRAYREAKKAETSFFLCYFYLSLRAANAVSAFRLRLEKDKPVIYDVVHGSPTVLRSDGGLGFSLLKYAADFDVFMKSAEPELERVKNQQKLDASRDRPDTIHYSIIPWIDFTAVSHPLDIERTEGIPILTFGKCREEGKKRTMPVAVHAHHALMDGVHIHSFLHAFQENLDQFSITGYRA